MTITEAIKEAQKIGGEITRKSFGETSDSWITFLPTNSINGTLIMIHNDKKDKITPRWEPKLEDLIAEDWETRR